MNTSVESRTKRNTGCKVSDKRWVRGGARARGGGAGRRRRGAGRGPRGARGRRSIRKQITPIDYTTLPTL